MAEYDFYQVDAFTDKVFAGNPAGVMPLTEWLPDETLQAIAMENNLAETAYMISKGRGQYDLRWFTPGAEVPLCGHATLATAHVLYTELGETAQTITFDTMSGPLMVSRQGEGYAMDFPADEARPIKAVPSFLIEALGDDPAEILAGQYILVVYDDAETVRGLNPNMLLLDKVQTDRGHSTSENCVCVTAPGDRKEGDGGFDFISRFFAPGIGISEDPVTGSAHCLTAPYWAARLGRTELKAFQASPRGGIVQCRVEGDRVILSGDAVTYLRGRISL